MSNDHTIMKDVKAGAGVETNLVLFSYSNGHLLRNKYRVTVDINYIQMQFIPQIKVNGI